jgi:hypothetical protein
MATAEDTVMLMVKEKEPLIVSMQRLVENSPVIAEIFVDL